FPRRIAGVGKRRPYISTESLRLSASASEPEGRAWTLVSFVRAQLARGERAFVFVPFFISAQGAIGSALRRDLERLRRDSGRFEFRFTDGLAARDALVGIAAARIRETIAARSLHRPAVIVVDHGGPSPASAALRNRLAADIRAALGTAIGPLAAASMEGAEHAHNHPLLADQLAAPGFDSGDVVIAPLFLSPGRHAGPDGDLTQIARPACPELAERAGAEPVDGTAGRTTAAQRCHFTGLIGTHPRAVDALAAALTKTLSTFAMRPPAPIEILA
ncbi:MAG: hypothetical protein HY736_14795, partial [Verrucomicrobia bacterium]|nr:hypothetical protein [Verrucomicrobiota bacterium]